MSSTRTSTRLIGTPPPDQARPRTTVPSPHRSTVPGSGTVTSDLIRTVVTGPSGVPREATYTYSSAWKTPAKGSVTARASTSHFTSATAYRPGTTRRTGAPCSGASGSPFMWVASRVSGCRAVASGRLRSKATRRPCTVPESAPAKTISTAA